MVWVFPVPVWPYAKTVQLYPAKTSSISGATTVWYTSACRESGPNDRSNVNFFVVFESNNCLTTISRGACTSTTSCERIVRSLAFRGLKSYMIKTSKMGKTSELLNFTNIPDSDVNLNILIRFCLGLIIICWGVHLACGSPYFNAHLRNLLNNATTFEPQNSYEN